MERIESSRQLESAGRTLAGALARLSVGEFKDAAALLRCTAKYLDGASGHGEPMVVIALLGGLGR